MVSGETLGQNPKMFGLLFYSAAGGQKVTTQPSTPAAPAPQGSGAAAQPARPPSTGPPPGLSENAFKKVTGDTPFTPEQLEKVE